MGKREVTEVGSRQMRLKDENKWVKIPDHHPAIVSRELFEQVQSQLSHFKSSKKNVNIYPLCKKVFCGCCRHAMPRTANKNHSFLCRYTQVDKTSPCYGLRIGEAELEAMIYKVLSRQAQIILNLDSLADAGQLDMQLAKQNECDRQVECFMEQKRKLYERFLLQDISIEDYKTQKAEVDTELTQLKRLQSVVSAQTAQMQMDEKTKHARIELAREITETDSLTARLADILVDRVYVYPGNEIEIIWKMKDFCVE